MALALYDYIDHRDANVIKEWAKKLGLDKRMRATLNQKLDMLALVGSELPTKLLSDTPRRNIKKIRINGTLALRPMLCKGPIANESEYTMLVGAIEKDRVFVPRDALQIADERRVEVATDPTRRCSHERF